MSSQTQAGLLPGEPKRTVFGVQLDGISPEEAVCRIMAWCRHGPRGGIVVTPNLDHVVTLRHNGALRDAYAKARLVLPDGKPLVWMARLDGGPRIELVTGADLIRPVCAAAAREGRRVFLFGSRAEVLDDASRRLRQTYPGLTIVGTYSPPIGFDTSASELQRAVAEIQAAAPDIVFAALGSPKQEIWSAEYAKATGASAILCIGAGLDFIAGAVTRAPPAFRRVGMEWLWRVLQEPRRLSGRYLNIMRVLPMLTVRHLLDQRRSSRRGRKVESN